MGFKRPGRFVSGFASGGGGSVAVKLTVESTRGLFDYDIICRIRDDWYTMLYTGNKKITVNHTYIHEKC